RYVVCLTVYRVVLTVIVWRIVDHTPELTWTTKWVRALDSLDDRTKSRLIQYHEQLSMLVIKRLVFGSPFLIAILSITAIVTLCKKGLTSVRDALRSSAKDTVASVVDPRLLEEEAAGTAAA